MRTFKDLDVKLSGAGDNTIVAIHGIQGTSNSWKPAAERLSGACRWVLPNLRGRADAWRGKQQSDYVLDAFADDMVRIISQYVSTPQYVLAGWSMGVSVALATFSKLRERGMALPAALILLSGSPVLRQTKWFNAVAYQDLLLEIASREKRLGLQDAADHDAVAWTWESIRDSDQSGLLESISVPTMILHGDADEDSPWSHAELLRKGIPQAQLSTIADGSHSILTSNTKRVADDIQKFLSELNLIGSKHEND